MCSAFLILAPNWRSLYLFTLREYFTCTCVNQQSTGLAYRHENERSTSGRGARASYRTMFPEILARWSLLEPSFRYLLPGSEGEKCRPLDHRWQVPFIHSVRLLIQLNFCVYIEASTSYSFNVVRTSVSWYNVYFTTTHAPFRNSHFKFQTAYLIVHLVYARASKIFA